MSKKDKIVVGIDVSKSTLDVSIYNGKEHKLLKPSNSYKSFKKKVLSKLSKYEKSDIKFVMENTGVYHLAIATELFKAGYRVSVENAFRNWRYLLLIKYDNILLHIISYR